MKAIIKYNKMDKYVNKLIIYSFSLYIFFYKIFESQILFYIPNIIHGTLYLTDIILIIVVLYKILRGKYNVIELFIYIVLGILSYIVFTYSMNITFSLILLYMIALKDVDRKMFFKWTFYAMLVSYILVISLALLGVIPNHPDLQTRYGHVRIRWFLGYNGNNLVMNNFLGIVLSYILYKNKLKIVDSIIIIFIMTILFIFTDSKTGLICILLVIFLYYLVLNNEKIYVVVSKGGIAFPLLSNIIMLLLSLFYDKKNIVLNKINSLITGRLSLAHDGFKRWPITLWGQITDMNFEKSTYNFVDTSCLNILFNQGLILVLIIIVMFTIYMWKVYKNKEKVMMIVLLIILIHSMIEPRLLDISNFPIIVLFISNFVKNE